MEVDLKFYLYQILGVFVIWLGMTFFLDEMYETGKYIYYALSLWLVLLIIFAIKHWFQNRKHKENNEQNK